MGTREVYEEKLRSADLHYDPTINPGLGSARCPRCLSHVDPNTRNGEGTITSVLHDLSAVAGSGIGALLSAVHGFNTGKYFFFVAFYVCFYFYNVWNLVIIIIIIIKFFLLNWVFCWICCRYSSCSEACERTQVGADCYRGSPTTIIFWSWCCSWSICSPKVCAAYSVILLCCLQCISLCNITGYSSNRRGPCF
ncbi:uncharacterized protein LOC109845562 isoform X1 [Asparagus officinalis]|uniref:uncharacterized protein LOC109845562 isoform X1 n=1 Tax=Asparagus officinalis TaxID=4686 RepID=UPI00098E6773|nr:uncharacterized protein LOC109845562 isoform X1 [Asparagus officinalis]